MAKRLRAWGRRVAPIVAILGVACATPLRAVAAALPSTQPATPTLSEATGAALAERSAAAAGTTARVTFFVRPSLIVQRSASGITIAGGGVAVTDVRNGPCDDNWCRIQGVAQVDPGARPGRRDARIEFTTGPPLSLANTFVVERRRMVVFALDGLAWDAFASARGRDTAFARLFAEDPGAAGRTLARVVRATFTPITFGRWVTMLSGAVPRETLVPSNKFLNRKAYTEVGGESRYGSPDQCLTCGGAVQAIWVTNPWFVGIFARSAGAYTQHFQVDLIYDRLRARGGRSVVILQQAGLGRGNAGDAQQDTFRRFNADVVKAGREKDARKSAELFDTGAMNLALDELRRNPELDLMVIYFGGLDHCLHDALAAGPDVAANSVDYVSAAVSPKIEQVVQAADDAWHGTAVYALFADHGHMSMDEQRWMDQTLQGAGVQIRSLTGVPQSWRSILSASRGYRVSNGLKAGSVEANVVFVPHGGIAHVYVAQNAGTDERRVRWSAPPSLETLRPLLNAIGATDALSETEAERPVTDVLVRQPGPSGGFAGSPYRLLHQPFVRVPDGCDADHPQKCEAATCGDSADQPCTLEAQLDLLRDLDGRRWSYADPERRVTDWISENTGDIVLLSNMAAGYSFESAPKRATHGSLTDGDALVPLAFSYPGLTDATEDTTLHGVRELLEGMGDDPVRTPIETRALAAYFGLPWWRPVE